MKRGKPDRSKRASKSGARAATINPGGVFRQKCGGGYRIVRRSAGTESGPDENGGPRFYDN
jgi:hypothetical protein